MLTIKEIHWIEKDSMEAEIIAENGKFTILCFSHPCRYILNQNIEDPVHCLEALDIIKSSLRESKLEKLQGYFEYRITGELIDLKEGLVRLGGMSIVVGNEGLPGDIVEGDYLSFRCGRLDIW